jgi:hypothetical protein
VAVNRLVGDSEIPVLYSPHMHSDFRVFGVDKPPLYSHLRSVSPDTLEEKGVEYK